MDENIIYYTYKCPICDCMVEGGFYDEPCKGHTFTCDADAEPHDLLIDKVDNENMTLEVRDFYAELLRDYEDYYKKQGRELPDDFSIGYVEIEN